MIEKIFDTEAFRRSHSHRIAYIEGKLDMCEEIRELASILMARNQLSPFKVATDFEDGQIAAFSAILESLAAIEQASEDKSFQEVKAETFDS